MQIVYENKSFNIVITIHKGNPFALGVVKTKVSGGAYATVRLVEGLDARVGGGVAVADVAGTVGTSIINKKQFPIGIGLRHDAVDAPLQILRSVVNRDYYTDFSHIAYNEKKKSPQASASARNCIAIRRRPSIIRCKLS